MTPQRGLAPGLHLGRHSHLGFQTPSPTPYAARLTVKEACKVRGLSVYRVAMSGLAQGTVDPGTVTGWHAATLRELIFTPWRRWRASCTPSLGRR